MNRLDKFIMLLSLSTLSYASMAMFNELFLSLFTPTLAMFLLFIALNEETTKWIITRNFHFKFGLYYILLISGIESIIYSIIIESYYTSLIIGIMFWYVFLTRLIYNGHLMFYISSKAVSQITNKFKILQYTGKNINILGYVLSVAFHFSWNYFLFTANDLMYIVLVLILSPLALFGLWSSGSIEELIHQKEK